MKKLLLFAAISFPCSGQGPVRVAAEQAALHVRQENGRLILEIQDPGNHAWVVQSASEPGNWQNGATLRVFNGLLRVPVPMDSTRRFFRLNSDLAGEVDAFVTSALLLPEIPLPYANPPLPAHLTTPVIIAQDNTPPGNPTTDAGATLGRVLFHDKRLSANQTVSCASCHRPEHGFADPRRFSVGFAGGLTGRNSMGLTNAKYYLKEKFSGMDARQPSKPRCWNPSRTAWKWA